MSGEQVTYLDLDIFTVSGIFTPGECRELIDRGEGLGFSAAGISLSDGGSRMMTHIRNNDRAMFDDPAFAAAVWERVRKYVPRKIDDRKVIGLGERFRFYRYDPGQQFKRHRDGRVTLDSGAQSRLSFLIYLNTEYEGGATRFTENEFRNGERIVHEIAVRPTEPGMGLFFIHERFHEGAEVTAGRKYVLRTDIFYAGEDAATPIRRTEPSPDALSTT